MENVSPGLGSYKVISEPIQVNKCIFWPFCCHFVDFLRYLRWVLGRLYSVHFAENVFLGLGYKAISEPIQVNYTHFGYFVAILAIS